MPKQAKTWATKKAKDLPPLSVTAHYQRDGCPTGTESADATEQNLSPGIARDKTLPYVPSRSPSPRGLLSPFESTIFPQAHSKSARPNLSERLAANPSLMTRLIRRSASFSSTDVSRYCESNKHPTATPKKFLPLKSGLLSDNQQSDTLHSAKSVEDYLIKTQKTVILRPTSPDSHLSEANFNNARPTRFPPGVQPLTTLRTLLSQDVPPVEISKEILRLKSPAVSPRQSLSKESTVSLPEDRMTETSHKPSWNTVSRHASCDNRSPPAALPRPSSDESRRREKACRVCGWIDCPLDDTRVSQFLHQLYPNL
ncbi:uncharacterized protein LOC122246725 [Penaeus japonicus]|uniref:uncharacterized protein LOC122246725 n=1 Tax=Penaeus japonicus TaxID=27405 RepID=UPI001C70F6D0|nr:uncharacterized protein LOC122246725 [Penaeus japonicus]